MLFLNSFYKNIDLVCEPQRSYFQPHCNYKAKAFLLQVFIFELENPSIIMKHDKSFILNNYKKKSFLGNKKSK